MKRAISLLLVIVMTTIALARCGSKSENPAGNADSNQPAIESITIKNSPDKYTWYIKNYVGKNCASIGYTSMGGDRMQKNGRRDNSLCTEIKSSIEILAVNEKEMTLSGNHVKGGGSYESPSLYMGHVVERCADRSTGRLLQISYVVHVVLIPAFFLQSPHLCNMKQNGYQNAAFECFVLMPFYDIVSFTAATTITGIPSSLSATLHPF